MKNDKILKLTTIIQTIQRIQYQQKDYIISRVRTIPQMTTAQEQLIADLNRRVALLDEYASTLEKQNLAKNNQTETLYNQLNDIRMENDILRAHLSRIHQENIDKMRREQSLKGLQRRNSSVNSSVEIDSQEVHRISNEESSRQSVSCQTQPYQADQPDPSSLHQHCTQQINTLLQTISLKDTKLSQLTNQSQHMYDTIVHLQQENQQLKRQYIELQTKFKTQSKQNKSYQIEIQELRNLVNEERELWDREKNQILAEKQNDFMAEKEVQRLVRENNRLIERVRMLEKEKNTFYAELRGKNVSPLKTSQLSNRQNLQPSGSKISFTSGNSQQKPQRFSSQFGIGKQKQKLKAQRWRKIEQKISQVKEQNEHLRANLTIV